MPLSLDAIASSPLDDAADPQNPFERLTRRRVLVIATGLGLLVSVCVLAVSLGTKNLPLTETARILADGLLPKGLLADIPKLDQQIVWNLRMPRIVMAMIAGAGLAVTGVMMQGITRNPLVSPFTIGLSPAAAFGASLAILFGALGVVGFGKYLIVAGAFGSALACAVVVLCIAGLRGVSATTMILAGIGLTYLFSAFTATLQFIATDEELAAIVHWTFGTLNAVTWDEALIAAILLAAALPVFVTDAWAMNAIAAGDETAASLGFDLRRVRLRTAILSVLVTAGIIAFTGVIGFVGLVAPHIARLIIGNDHRFLIPFSMIVGALLLLVADTIGRSLFSPAVIPVGIVVAYVGVPLFVHLILRQRREAYQ